MRRKGNFLFGRSNTFSPLLSASFPGPFSSYGGFGSERGEAGDGCVEEI